MRIKSIKTIFGDGSFRQIKNVFPSLPYEKNIANAIHGDMKEFLQYVENSKEERNSPESNGSFYYHDYSEVQYRTSVKDGQEYLTEVTFITPTSSRVITIKEIGVIQKSSFYTEPCNDYYEIIIDFGEDGSSYAANEVICGLKTNSFNDQFTEIKWMDGRTTSALDYKMATLDKLSLRRSSYTAIYQYDKVMNSNRPFVIFSDMPQVDLLAHSCELLVDQRDDFDGDLVDFIESQYYEKFYREIFVDRYIYDLIVDKVTEPIKDVLTIVPRELVDGDSILVYNKSEKKINGLTYIRD